MKETPLYPENPDSRNRISGIESRLKSLRRKVKLWFLADGLSRLVILLLLYLAIIFGIDYLIRDLPVPLRLCFLVLAVFLTLFVLIKKTIIPVIKLNQIPDDALIFLIEKRFPALKERLINLWQLPASNVPSDLTSEIIPASQSYDFTKILFPDSSRKLLLGALTLLLLSIISITFYPAEIGIWGQRLLGSSLTWPKRTILGIKVTPDYTIARGQNFSVTAWPAKGPRLNAVYIRTEASGKNQSNWERMLIIQTKDRGTEFRYDFTRVQSPFRFMLKGGDDQTDWIEINVLNAPSLGKISIRYSYPLYTDLPDKTEIGGNIKAPAGTQATINALADIPLQSASLLLNSNPLSLTLGNNLTISTTLTVATEAKYSFNLVGTNGLKNLEPIEYSIKSIPDNHPIIKVLEPANEIQYVTPDATIPLKAAINDDYGISDARIIYTRSDGASESEDNSSAMTRTSQTFYSYTGALSDKIEITTMLDLAPLDLKDSSYLTLNFIATDNCAIPSAQTTTSADYSLIVISKPQMEKKVSEAILQLKDDLKKTLQIQEAARQAQDIQQSLANQRRVSQNLNNSSSMLASILNDINNNKLFAQDIADKLNDIQKNLDDLSVTKSPAAQQSLEKAASEKDTSSRAQAQVQQQGISDELKNILSSMEQWEDYQEVVNNVRDLMSEAQDLAERIKKSSSSDETASRELEKERLNEMAKNLQKESNILQTKMGRVAEKLKDTQSYYSAKLKQGLAQLKSEDGINPDLLSLQSNLSSSLSGQAIKDAENIQADLSSLLNFLEDRINPEEVQKKLVELRKTLEQVSQLKDQETKLADDTARIMDPTGQISAVAQELDSLLMDQKALKEVTEQAFDKSDPDKLPDIMKKLAEAQKELQNQAQDLAERLDQANKELQPESNPDVQSAAKSMQSSAEKMAQAQQKMNQSTQPPPNDQAKQQSTNQQKDALQDLRQTRESLRKFLEHPPTEEEKRKLAQLAQRQKEIKEATEKAAKEAEKQSKESLQAAAQKMSQAQKKMSDSKPQEAEEDEQDALDELDRLYEMLDKQIDELSQRQKKDQMEKLVDILKKIQAGQTDINARTSTTLDKPGLSREDNLVLKKISGQQLQLSDDSLELKTKLDKEKSQTFSWMLGAIRDNMQLSARLLAQPRPQDEAAYIQETQAAISSQIKDLLDAFKNELNKRKPLQAESGDMEMEDDGKLMSLYAELKMARTIQEYLIARTESIKKELLKNPDHPDPALNGLLQRLSSEQGNLADMIKELTKLVKEREAKKQKP